MKINFHTESVLPMAEWLKKAVSGTRDEAMLRRILQSPDYAVEFERYSSPGLPVCGISFEEAVDFFMNFDKKDFENQRLQYKKAGFLEFVKDIDARTASAAQFTSITAGDTAVCEKLLSAGLPDELAGEIEVDIILIISIGNSMGWPFGHYIDFDVANLGVFGSISDFMHVIAHEIHHTYFMSLVPESMTPGELFLINFAFEGLAVHFNNNMHTLYKPSKCPGEAVCMADKDMRLYESEFEPRFAQIRDDYHAAESMTDRQVGELIASHYERFDTVSFTTGETVTVSQYPTYYFGCYLWGIIDTVFGKDELFRVLKNPSDFVRVYNEAVKKTGDTKYLL